jgi:hypothetical protein
MVSPWMRYSTVLEHLKGPRIPTNVEKYRLVRPSSFRRSNRAHTCLSKLLEVAEGVAYLHRQNVVHGNLSGVRIVTAIICYPMTIFND